MYYVKSTHINSSNVFLVGMNVIIYIVDVEMLVMQHFPK